MAQLALNYTPPGPVAAGFMRSRARVRAIMGPVGSGKTSVCLLTLVFLASQQKPSPLDGVRYTKFAVIRDTYRNLESTTLKSWHGWIPKTTGEFTGGQPARHVLRFDLPDGTSVNLEVEFIALGDNRIEDVMRGWEGTGVYLNEADRLAPEALTYALGRVGRYPAARHGGPDWSGVLLDFNAPDTENWCYQRFVEDLPEGWEFHRQPSGLAPDAENMANLPEGYYAGQMAGQPEWYIRRMVRNEFGFSRDGKPVYDDFADATHVAPEPLDPVPGLPVAIGMDFGLTPAAILGQQMPSGQWRILDELISPRAGVKQFAGPLLSLLAARYPGAEPVIWADPAGNTASQNDDTESAISTLRAATGLTVRPAPGNNSLSLRLDAVAGPLRRMIDGQPGFLLSPACKVLRKGFNSGYAFKRVAIGGGTNRYGDKPDKNEFSHPHDALQYLMLGGGEGAAVLGRERRRHAARPRRMDTGWDALGISEQPAKAQPGGTSPGGFWQ